MISSFRFLYPHFWPLCLTNTAHRLRKWLDSKRIKPRDMTLSFKFFFFFFFNLGDIPWGKENALWISLHTSLYYVVNSLYSYFVVCLFFSGVTFKTLLFVCCGCEYIAVEYRTPHISTLSFIFFLLRSTTLPKDSDFQ